MKLLFDENLAPDLAASLAPLYPGSAHVHALGLGSADDAVVWQYARDHGFTIVTRDAESILRRHAEDLRNLEESGEAGVLVLV